MSGFQIDEGLSRVLVNGLITACLASRITSPAEPMLVRAKSFWGLNQLFDFG